MLHVSVICLGELWKGFTAHPAARGREVLRRWFEDTFRPWFAGRILPVTEAVAQHWGILDGECQIRGLTLSVTDGLIAATALITLSVCSPFCLGPPCSVSVPFAKGIALSVLHIIHISKTLAILGMRDSWQMPESHKSPTNLREITRRPRSNWRIRTPRTSLGRACDPVVLR